MTNPPDQSIAVRAIKHAIPYIRLYKGGTFVIKAGGAVLGSSATTREFVDQVATLHQLGIRTVVVHGGGPQSDALSHALGITPHFVEGRRITDEKSLELSAMVLNGSLNTQLLAHCRDVGIKAIGMSGVDAGLVRAVRRPPVEVGVGTDATTVDYGHVGDILSVDTSTVEQLLQDGIVPIISPLSADDSGGILNINADTVAAEIAISLQAEKLILVSSPAGLLADPNDASSLISYLDLEELNECERSGQIAGGMLPKIAATRKALTGGVTRVHMISFKIPDSLLLEVFTNEGSGTLIVKDRTALQP